MKKLDITKRQAIAALVLAISGISAVAVPFVLHTLPSAGDNGNTSDNTGDTKGSQGSNSGGNSPAQTPGGDSNVPTTRGPKTIQDLANSVAACQTENRGTQRSLQAKVDSAMRAKNSSAREHHVQMLMHKLETPAADKHASSCISNIRAIVNQLA